MVPNAEYYFIFSFIFLVLCLLYSLKGEVGD